LARQLSPGEPLPGAAAKTGTVSRCVRGPTSSDLFGCRPPRACTQFLPVPSPLGSQGASRPTRHFRLSPRGTDGDGARRRMAANPHAAESPTSTAECDHDEGLRGTGSLGRDPYDRYGVARLGARGFAIGRNRRNLAIGPAATDDRSPPRLCENRHPGKPPIARRS
jgi:hypothetical protein